MVQADADDLQDGTTRDMTRLEPCVLSSDAAAGAVQEKHLKHFSPELPTGG